MNQLVLIRGLPGSGKSTIAKSLSGFEHFEADMFHMKDGEYKYDKTKQREAHQWCQRETFIALQNGKDVVVSNTFTQNWEMDFYRKAAEILSVTCSIIEAKGRFKNIHNVPDDVIGIMAERWEVLK